MIQQTPSPQRELFGYRKYWAQRFGVAPCLPMSRAEMDELGWDSCDVIIVTGDAYVDHPSFGMAIVGRLLEAQGFRVGIIAQPDWREAAPFAALGAPNLFFGITAGNMDSMVNRYTSERRVRSDDAYTPGGEGGRRPDRSLIVYAQRAREALKRMGRDDSSAAAGTTSCRRGSRRARAACPSARVMPRASRARRPRARRSAFVPSTRACRAHPARRAGDECG